MAKFLRDSRPTDLSIDEEALKRLSEIFRSRWLALCGDYDPQSQDEIPAVYSFIVRFDNKGYRVFGIDDVLRYFRDAEEVERVIFQLQDSASLSTGGTAGASIELRLDSRDPNNCVLSATSDDCDWVDSSFAAVTETLEKSRTRNRYFRSAWTALVIQLVGVLAGFAISLWAGSKIAQNLSIENAFLISFLLALLVFSNLWTYLNGVLQGFVLKTFPNLQFYRPNKDRTHWLVQTVVGGMVVAATLYGLGKVFEFAGSILNSLVQ